jgi:hypothetical protein
MTKKIILGKYRSIVLSSWKKEIKTLNQFKVTLDYMSEQGINPTTALAIEYNFVTDNLNTMDKYKKSSEKYKFKNLNLMSCSKPIDVVEKCFHPFNLSISKTAYKLMIEELKKRDETEAEILETIHEYASNVKDVTDGWA